MCTTAIQESFCFQAYRHLQDQWILDPAHKERTKRDIHLSGEPTVRELEEHFILFEMQEFEHHYAIQGLTQRDYILGEIEEMRSTLNIFFTGIALGHDPTGDELAWHYIMSHANDTYRERFWHLIAQ